MRRSAWPMRALNDALQALAPGLAPQVELVDSIDSTNSELMRRARDGRRQAVLLVAQRQTAGRGRMGRSWNSDQTHAPAADASTTVDQAPASLTFSLGMPLEPPHWSGLSLAVGVSVAQSLHPALMLKWPNDVWLHQRKLAGILIETAGTAEARRFAVIGVGVNIAPPESAGLSMPAASLRELAPELDAPDRWRGLHRRCFRPCWFSRRAVLPRSRPRFARATPCSVVRWNSAMAAPASPMEWTPVAHCGCILRRV